VPREVDPINDADLYDSIDLGGTRSPGVVTLSGHDREIDWDVKVGPGTTGGTTTLKAEKLVEFSASFYLADEDDFAGWPAFRSLINSTVEGTGKGIDVFHPDLESNGIRSVVKKSIGGVVHDRKGGQTIVVKFLEYRPPQPKRLSPAGSSSKGKGPDPDAAAKAELAALTSQFQSTPWG